MNWLAVCEDVPAEAAASTELDPQAIQRKTLVRHTEKTFRLPVPFRASPLRDLAKVASIASADKAEPRRNRSARGLCCRLEKTPTPGRGARVPLGRNGDLSKVIAGVKFQDGIEVIQVPANHAA